MSTLLFILAALFIWQATMTYEVKTQAKLVFCFFMYNFLFLFYKFTWLGIFEMICCFIWWCGLMHELEKRNEK